MKEYVEKILVPYIDKKRTELKLLPNQPALLIFDNFKAQTTSSILTLLDSHNINVALLPANCTNRLQPLDLSVNKRHQRISCALSFKIGMLSSCVLSYRMSQKRNQ